MAAGTRPQSAAVKEPTKGVIVDSALRAGDSNKDGCLPEYVRYCQQAENANVKKHPPTFIPQQCRLP